MIRKSYLIFCAFLLFAGISIGYFLACSNISTGLPELEAAGSGGSRASMADPNGTVSNPYAYYPGTEPLGKDEIRVVACGTPEELAQVERSHTGRYLRRELSGHEQQARGRGE